MINLRVLGSLHIGKEDGQDVLSVAAQPKRAALLTYLAVAQPGGHVRRDTLVGIFWPETDQQRARHALSQALYALRASLADEVVRTHGGEEVGIDGSLLWCDAVEFGAAFQRGDYEEALDLYQGSFLEGFFLSDAPEFEKWLDLERSRLRAMAAEAAWCLAEREESAGRIDSATARARQAAAYREDEVGLRRLIGLLDRAGDRAAAIREYEAFAIRMRQELELEPSPETRELVAEIRARIEPHDAAREDPARGVRLPASTERPNTVVSDASTTAQNRPQRSRMPWASRRTVNTVLLIGLVAMASLALVRFFGSNAAYSVENPRQSFVIPPFNVIADDPDLAWLGTGTPNMLALGLGVWEEIRVVDRRRLAALSTARGFSLSDASLSDALAVARDAQVGTLILGDIIAQAGAVEVAVRIYDVATEAEIREPVLVSGSAGDDLRPLVDRIAIAILDLGEAGNLRPDIRAATTSSLDAFRDYSEGLDRLYVGDFDEAAERFESAVARDSTFALAYYRLALADGWREAVDARLLEIAASAVRHSARLPWRERQAVLGFNAFLNEDYGTARETYEQLLASDSTDAETWYHLAEIESHDQTVVRDSTGAWMPAADFNRALYAYERAVELDPGFGLVYGHLFQILVDLSRQGYRIVPDPDSEGDLLWFFLAWRDSAFWVPYDSEIEDRQDFGRRWWSDSLKSRMRDRGGRLAERWANAAPDQSRPFLELRNMHLEVPAQYDQALAAQQALLGFSADTTARERLILAHLLLANGDFDAAMSQADAALETPGYDEEADVNFAVGLFAATGQPRRALESIPDAYRRRMEAYSPMVPTPEGTMVRVRGWGALDRMRVFGVSGAASRVLDAEVDSLRRSWKTTYTAEELGNVICAMTPVILPVILLGNSAPEWVADLSDSPSDHCDATAMLSALAALAVDSIDAAGRSFEKVMDRVGRRPPFPRLSTLHFLATVARGLGRHDEAIELYQLMNEVGIWHNRSRDAATGFNWGLVIRSYLDRAQSYEALGNQEEARFYYERFLAAWQFAEPELRHFADEAREGLVRLDRYVVS